MKPRVFSITTHTRIYVIYCVVTVFYVFVEVPIRPSIYMKAWLLQEQIRKGKESKQGR